MTALIAVWVSFCQAGAPGFDDPVLYPAEVFAGEEAGGGQLSADTPDDNGVTSAFVVNHTSIVAEVTAGLARVTMVQWFQNP